MAFTQPTKEHIVNYRKSLPLLAVAACLSTACATTGTTTTEQPAATPAQATAGLRDYLRLRC